MNIAVLGTGVVGRTLAAKLAALGHDVRMGTRDVAALNDRDDQAFSEWAAVNAAVRPATFADAAAHGEMVVNATSGTASLAALREAGAMNLAGKPLVDVANPLDFSTGFPPTLTVANDNSLGEQIQAAFPDAKVVKTLNTVNTAVMVDPAAIGDGEHEMFVAGNHDDAKEQVIALLTGGFGWRRVTDLGDITNARAMEMYLPLWVRLYGSLGTGAFNIRIVQ